jgi:hypothetical protein
MSKWICVVLSLMVLLIVMAGAPAASLADFNSRSTGVDGPLTPVAPPNGPSSYVVPANTNGVYNYTIVNIPSGVTVTFQKNAANNPITLLASGDVTISGTISVNGAAGNNTIPGTGGPGGFDGGVGGYVNTAGYRGQGPGGGVASSGIQGGAGGFSSAGSVYQGCSNCYPYNCSNSAPGGGAYGNASSLPLIGGSGGGGGTGTSTSYGGGGGGGGGAIVIASSGTINAASSGSITALGGNGAGATFFGGGGSGGAIRLIATTITGEGSITATGGSGGGTTACNVWGSGAASVGRIRLEAWQITRTSNTNPTYTTLLYPVAVNPDSPPSLAITQINDISSPSPTFGAFRTPDVTLPYNTTGPVMVTVTAQNVPAGKVVTVKALPESGNNVITATGTLDATSTVQVQLALSSGTAYVLSASVNF